MQAPPRSISVVVPVLDEVDSLDRLHEEIAAVCRERSYRLQLILVDDGSTDGSWEKISALATRDPRVIGVRFRRNFGKAAALEEGFSRADGEVIVMMDADLQDTPAELPKLLAKLDEGCDIVTGWKQTRHDPWHKRYPSKLFNSVISTLSGVRLHDHNCGFKCFRREVASDIDLYGERHRFIAVLGAAKGYRAAEVPVAHRARTTGNSKYGLGRIPKGLLDALTIPLVTRFRSRPQHWLGSAGLLSLLLGAGCMTTLAARWVLSRVVGAEPLHLHETASLYYAIVLVIVGAQFLAVGLIGELIVAVAAADRSAVSIRETTEDLLPATTARRGAA
ncbi:MAG: glycosyltransferase family 2 protein [Planctomycetota bacterium]